jgi:beta-glucuronidase
MRIASLLAGILFLACGAVAGQEADLIQKVAARQTIALSGSWQAIVDPYEAGYYDYRYRPRAGGGMGANRKPKSKSEFVEYDFDTASRLKVPGDWNTQRPKSPRAYSPSPLQPSGSPSQASLVRVYHW